MCLNYLIYILYINIICISFNLYLIYSQNKVNNNTDEVIISSTRHVSVAVASTGYLLEIDNSLQSEEEYATMVSFYIIDIII